MKRILIFLIAFLLCGCAIDETAVKKESIEAVLSDDSTDLKLRANNSSKYYSYYLPSDLIEEKYEKENCYFVLGDTTILMNLNVSGIISEAFYSESTLEEEGLFDEAKLVFSKSGNLTGYESESLPYSYNLYQYGDHCYSHLMTPEINIYARSTAREVAVTLKHMMILAKGVKINKDLVIDEFSNKDVIEYKKNTINLFQYAVPTNGVLEDLDANASTLEDASSSIDEDYEDNIEEVSADNADDDD